MLTASISKSAPDTAASDGHEGVFSLVELMLKDRPRVDQLVRIAALQAELIPRFLAAALGGFTVFGVVLTLLLNSAAFWPRWVPAAKWGGASLPNLILAYDLGLIAATGVCLPSFYFFGLLAGVRTTMLDVVTHAMKGTAASATALIGILPVYVVIALGLQVLHAPNGWMAPVLYLGLALPFVAGLWGMWSLYEGFVLLVDTLPAERRCSRECFLRRLILAWSCCYTAVTPVMIYTLWHTFSA